MKISKLLPLAITLALLGAAVSEAEPAAPAEKRTMHVYHVGNSLTRGLTLAQLHELMATRGIDYQFGAQLAGGTSLRRHWDVIAGTTKQFKTKTWETRNPAGGTFEPCHPDWEKNPFPERFGKYDQALTKHKWDALVLQLYGAHVEEDVGAIRDFIALAEKNRSAKRYYIYSTWPQRPGAKDAVGTITAQPIDYQAAWSRVYDDAARKDWKDTYASRDGRTQLMKRLRAEYDGKLGHPICTIPAGEVLCELDKKIKAGQIPGLAEAHARNPKLLPGWNPETGVKAGVNILYADPIHLNPIPHLEGTVGTYAVAMTVMSVLTASSPVGLTGKIHGLDDEKDAALVKALQETVWEVVKTHPYAGIARANQDEPGQPPADRAGAEKDSAVSARDPVDKETVPQPRAIPGQWKMTDQPLPPLKDIIGRPPTRRPVYGLYCWASEYVRYHDAIRKIGFTNFRLSGPMSDECMKLYVADGIEVMATLSARFQESFGGGKRDWRNRATYDTDEAFIADYLAGVDKFLSRWGPDGTFFKDHPDLPQRPLRFIEIWNEPNFWYLDADKMVPPKDEADRLATEARREKLYAKLLPAAYQYIKKKWPDVQVVGFAAGGAAYADVRFIEHVHAANSAVAGSYDILSTHPYVRPVPPETNHVRPWGQYSIAGGLAEIRRTMQKAGTSDRPIWYTELNWTITQEEGGAYKTDKADTTALLAAAYWVRSYALALRLGVERLNFMSVVDTDNCNSGLLNRAGSWRPSAHAVKTMIDLMPHPQLIAAEADGADGRYALWFRANAQAGDAADRVLVAWKVDGPGTLEIAWPHAKAKVTDMLGKERVIESMENRLSVEIGPCPVYVQPAK